MPFKIGDKVIFKDKNGVQSAAEVVSGPHASMYATYDAYYEICLDSDKTLRHAPESRISYPFVALSTSPSYAMDGIEIDEDDLYGLDAMQSQLKCECGSDSVGGGRHSTWCPKGDK